MKIKYEKCNLCNKDDKNCDQCEGTGKVELNTTSPMAIIEGEIK